MRESAQRSFADVKGYVELRQQNTVAAIRILIGIGVTTRIIDSHLGHQLKLLLQMSKEEVWVHLIV